jgi:arylsulfatase A-like enzyme
MQLPLPNRRLSGLIAVLVLAAAVVGYVLAREPANARRATIHTSRQLQAAARRRVQRRGVPAHPNIVFVLTDDLSMDLLQFMPHVLGMERTGFTFDNYFVSDSLCCPSRTSIFTGDYPHDSHVFNNVGRNGGFGAFYAHGDQNHTFATALQGAGYATAMMGKYLNGYLQSRGSAPVPDTYVPPGWSEWDVAGWGYPEYDYTMNSNGTLVQYGSAPSDYLTNVIAGKGIDFINRSVAAGQPFFLELSTFSPHSPYTPAPQDTGDFPGLGAPRPPNFDVLPTDPPHWLAVHPPLSGPQIANIDEAFRLRAQAVQSVDRMIAAIQATLQADGVGGDTYVVFSSDNGLHTGEYRLAPGKMTAFDTDIHVPLVVTGPGVAAGRGTRDVTENIDLAATFAQIAGRTMGGDGHSLLTLLHGQQPASWRNAALVEHDGSRLASSDPDFQQPGSGNPTTYEAMRTPEFLYVEYTDGEREFYDLRNDPFELHNIASQLSPYDLGLLHVELARMKSCHGQTACWAATHVDLHLGQLSHTAPLP